MTIWTSYPTYYFACTVVVHQGSPDDDCRDENNRVAMAYLEPLVAAGIKVEAKQWKDGKPHQYHVMCKSHDEECLAKPAIESLRKIIAEYDPLVEWALTNEGVVTWPVGEEMPESVKGKRIGACGRSPKSLARFMGGQT